MSAMKRMPSRFHPSTVWRVAITGGPCGGKTTALATLRERLPQHGVSVLVVPEFATMFFHGAVSKCLAGWGAHPVTGILPRTAHG